MIPGLDPTGPATPEEEAFYLPPQGDSSGERPSKYLFENGQYAATIVSFVKGVSKSSGNPQYVVKFIGTQGKAKGIDYNDYYPLTPTSLWKLERLAEAVNCPKNDKGDFTILPANFVKQAVTLDLVQEEYDGKKRMKVKQVLPVETLDTLSAAADLPF